MEGLQVFHYQGRDFRAIEQNGQPWFVLPDVCRVLGLGSPHKVAERLDEDEKGRNLIPTPGGLQETTIINESGLYAVILRSDKPEARPFRKWVTAEVLPSIRRTGAYNAPAPPVSPQDKVMELMEELMRARSKIADLRVAAAQKEVEDLRLELEVAWAHDEKADRKRELSRERVRRFRERQKQAQQPGKGLLPAE